MEATTISESAVRARARARGYIVRKCRTRNPEHPGYGTYMLVDANSNQLILGDVPGQAGYGESLESIVEFLS
jgi:hypothetical protein